MKKVLVTIGRQFGSGGGEIAKKAASLLEIPCYDKELIIKAAENSGISREKLEQVDERATNSFLYSLAMSGYNGQITSLGAGDVVMSDRLFSVQAEIIRNFSEQSSCVILGRCADDILTGKEGLIRVFICAPTEDRVNRIMTQHSLTEQNARSLVKKTDKKRASYYNFYTSKSWGATENYDLVINSSVLGIERSASVIKDFVELYAR